jgi:glutaredoxin
MAELILHSYRRCPFAIRVRMALEEKELAYRLVEENLAELSDELLRIHPEGRVPVLIHDGHVIVESTFICESSKTRWVTSHFSWVISSLWRIFISFRFIASL